MQNYDPKVAARVWERVQQPSPVAEEEAKLLPLIGQILCDAATYQRLSRKLPPPQAAILRQMAAQLQASAQCLKGIYAMRTGSKATVSAAAAEEMPAAVLLRKCYGQEMGRLAHYEARKTDPQYGPVYRRLAEQTQSHCQKLLELFGTLNQP